MKYGYLTEKEAILQTYITSLMGLKAKHLDVILKTHSAEEIVEKCRALWMTIDDMQPEDILDKYRK